MDSYKGQVKLLLDVLPIVAKEHSFALHGGTAINLFVRNMPRLSVDIDLTYINIEEREVTFQKINEGLQRIKSGIESVIQDVKIHHQKDVAKLLISTSSASIKIEVNTVGRGLLGEPIKLQLCDVAQKEFDVFVAIDIVPIGQLYGGKICAALDRQHPRDLFDVKHLLDNEGFSAEVKKGFILSLAGSSRPIHELIVPNLLDQRNVMKNHFDGMSKDAFTYEEFEATRNRLISTISQNLLESDKEFILSIESGEPKWGIYDFEKFPAVRWKLQNLQKVISGDPEKHRSQILQLEKKLFK